MICQHPTKCRRLQNKAPLKKKHLLCRECYNRAAVWTDEKRHKVSENTKIACANPEWRRKQSLAKKALWADPVWRAKWQEARKTVAPGKQLAAWDRKMREIGIPFSERRALIAKQVELGPT